jgi:hypothetical protein
VIDAPAREQYRSKGYALAPGLLPREVGTAFLARLQADLARQGATFAALLQPSHLLRAPAAEVYGHHFPMLAGLHWGMTPTIADCLGEDLLPTYAYFRLYRQGDICRVHCDRYACEHSVSLTLAYSDDRPWALEVATVRDDMPRQRADEAFAPGEAPEGVVMQPGDAVLYQGVHHHHARTSPNPNAWSAHLFLHWVSRNGPYAGEAFDKQLPPERVTIG